MTEVTTSRNPDLLTDVCGVILAGGNSSRYGTNKALVPWQGKTLIRHVADTLETVFAHCLLVTNTPDIYAFLGWPSVADIHPGAGPLAGIHAALTAITEDRAFICGCDMPFLDAPLVRYLCRLDPDETDVVLPQLADGPEPLCAVYHKKALPVIETSLKRQQRKIGAVLENLKVHRVGEAQILAVASDLTCFHNVNRPRDLARPCHEKTR